MGDLNIFDLNKYKCNVFIETGTGKGTGIEYALQFPFEEIHSIEIHDELYDYCIDKFLGEKRVTLWHGDSIFILKKLLKIIPQNDRCLFWLDAHFPGADFGLGEYKYNTISMPLEDELIAIARNKDYVNDVFIIDDLRLYEDGEFELGDIDIGKPKEGLKLFEYMVAETHNIERLYRHQGFMIATPKKK
jgi:hypothetical protein